MTLAESARARKLILDALHLDSARPDLASVMRMQAEDWDEFLRLAGMHRLGPMLHAKLARGDLAEAVPQEVKDRLKVAHRKHTLRNLKIYRELVTVTRILDAAQIPSIALKGAFLAQFAYAEPGLRPMRDLDLLLRTEQAVQAFELLRAHGYRSMFEGAPEAYFADRIHLPPLTGPGGISVELHHRLTPPGGQAAGFEEGLWARSISRTVVGVPVRFLCPEDMLLHLCIHATLDHQLDLGPLALADVALLVEKQAIDWPGFIGLVSDGNWQRCALAVLYLARRHLGARISDEVIAALGGGADEQAWLEAAEYLLFSDPGDHKLLDYDVQEILYSGKLSERLSRLAGAAFPPRSAIARHFPVSADSPMAFLYYPRRWYRLFTGKLPGLLKAHVGRKQSLRELAEHRRALCGWLEDGSR
ncbi:MAG TPA: nucleotidyltransferase family protein [Gallionella sp.]|nr:nucleotidyltransferase family protein [Gallionella sp.]